MKNVASNTIKSKTLIRFKDVCVNKEHRVLLSYCRITAIPALKVGHTCTAGSATTDCGDATTTHLECSATAPTVCVCSTGYSGPTAATVVDDKYSFLSKGKKTNKKHSPAFVVVTVNSSPPPQPPSKQCCAVVTGT